MIDEAAKLYESGLSTGEVAKRLGRSQYVVVKALRTAGVSMRKPNSQWPIPPDLDATIMRGLGMGRQCHEIANDAGVSLDAVNRRAPALRKNLMRAGAVALGLIAADEGGADAT